MQSEGDTSGISPDAGASLGIADRRAQSRQRVTSIAYIELGDNNGGIVLNVSEGGLAFAAVGVLSIESLPRIRIQLPRSREWTEISGQFAWISESKKEAGIRFENLTDEVRHRIKDWISSEVAASEPSRDNRSASQNAVPPSPTLKRQVPPPSAQESAAPNAIAAEPTLDSISSASPELSRDTRELAAPATPQPIEESSSQVRSAAISPRTPERRAHARRHVKSLSYVELGDRNGGIILNMSEDGLHVQAAVTLTAERIPVMRFQLPQSRAQIEVAGKIVWASDSKKEAGIQFIDLPEDDRAKLREWIASEPPLLEIDTAKRSERESSAPPLDSAKAQVLKRPLPKPETIAQPVRTQPHLAIASRIAVAPQPHGNANAEVPRQAPALRVLKSPVDVAAESQRKPPFAWMNLGLRRQTWEVIAALIVIVAAISFSVGWFAARRGAQNEVAAVSETKEEAANEPAKTVPPPSTSEPSPTSSYGVEKAPVVQGRAEAPPATSKPRPVNSAVEPARPKSDVDKHPLASVVSEVPKATTKGKNSPATPTQPRVAPATPSVASTPPKKIGAPNPDNVVAQPVQASPVPPSPAPNPPESAPAIVAKEKETIAQPPAPKEPEIPAIPQGTVSISSPPFPSIRVPAELKSQISKLGASLQIGQLISRVTPAYPEDVRRERVEGTVKLHAIIGKDGAVQNVALLSGPTLLAAPAINAILEWRFKPTLLGGQAIETEEDITVVFRLQNSAARSN